MIVREKLIALTAMISSGIAGYTTTGKNTHGILANQVAGNEENARLCRIARIPEGIPARLHSLPARLGNRTPLGDLGLLSAGLCAVVSGYLSLFVDLPAPVLGILFLVSLGSLVLTAAALPFRFSTTAPALPQPESVLAGASPSDEIHLGYPMKNSAPLLECPPDGTLDTYWIESPHVSIRITRKGNQGFTYTVIEPVLSVQEQVVLRETYARLRKVILYDDPMHPPEDPFNETAVSRIIREFYPEISGDRLSVVSYYLRRDLSGYGVLDALMRDPALEDISCNGGNLPVFVFHRVHGSLPTSIVFYEADLDRFVLKLAQKANRQISLSNPMVDATLPGGSRLQVTFSNVISLRGSSFTIRKFRADPMTPPDLIRLGTYSPEILAFLWLVIEHRRSLIIAGGTASGKTSTMNAISLFIPLNAKIVSLEDTHEIQLPHRNWLATITRESGPSAASGDIDLFSLLKASMRQRPEFIIVGEVRGHEAQTLFQAMNTGHATLSTIHAGSVREAINRLIHEPINVPPVMFTALDLVVSQSILTYGNSRIRRCSAIHEIAVDMDGTIIPTKLFEWDVRTDTFRVCSEQSRVLDEIATLRGWTRQEILSELKKREEFLHIATEVPNPEIQDLARAIHDLGE